MHLTKQPRTDWSHAQRAVEHYLFNPTNETLREVFNGYERLILRLAHKYTSLAPLDDLVGVGNIGLIIALTRYDVTEGKFSTIAVPYIQGYMRHYLTRKNHTIRLPSWVVSFYQKDAVIRAALEAEGIIVTDELVAKKHEKTLTQYNRIKQRNPLYLMESIEHGEQKPETTTINVKTVVPRALQTDVRGHSLDDPATEIKALFHTLFTEAKGKSVMKIAQMYKCDLISAQEIHELVHQYDTICHV